VSESGHPGQSENADVIAGFCAETSLKRDPQSCPLAIPGTAIARAIANEKKGRMGSTLVFGRAHRRLWEVGIQPYINSIVRKCLVP
jgi:hypothetical protein